MDLVSTRNCSRSCAFTYTLDGGDAQTVTLEATLASAPVFSLLNLSDLVDTVHIVHLKDFEADACNSLVIDYALITSGDDAYFGEGRVFIDRNDPSVVSKGSDNG